MGAILRVICDCGFTTDISAGGGFADHRTHCWAPALCLSCMRFQVHNYLEPHTQCPECGRTVTFYNDPIMQRTQQQTEEDVFSWRVKRKEEFRLPDTLYLCPQCGRKSLKFVQIGNWD